MFKPEDLQKIILENQKYLEDEYNKDWDKWLDYAKNLLKCPIHGISEPKVARGDFKMDSQASMFSDCPICNPNGQTKTQQTQNTAKTSKPEEKTPETAKPNTTPKPNTQAKASQGNSPIETPFLDKLMKEGGKIIQDLVHYGKIAGDFTVQHGANVAGGLIDGMSFGLIPHNIGDKKSPEYQAAEWFSPNPLAKVGKVIKGIKATPKAWDKLIKISKVSKIIPKINANKLPHNVQNAINKYKNSKKPWSGTYSGAPPGKMNAGGVWRNEHNQLPEFTKDRKKITYKEYDVNPKIGDKRDAERLLKSSDGKLYYTDSHYGRGKSKHGLPDFVEIINY